MLQEDEDADEASYTEKPVKSRIKNKTSKKGSKDVGPIFDRATSIDRDAPSDGRAAYSAMIAAHEALEAEKLRESRASLLREQMIDDVPADFGELIYMFTECAFMIKLFANSQMS